MDLELKNQIALVTASSGGIGLAIATRLAAEGAKTIVNGRSESSVEKGLAQIRKAVPDASLIGMAADNGTAEGVTQTINALPDVDILTNNLGVFEAISEVLSPPEARSWWYLATTIQPELALAARS